MKSFDDENVQNKKKGWILIAKIKKIIQDNNNRIDFSQLKEKLMFDDELDDELKTQLTEEELKRLVSKYDTILGNVYKKFLENQDLEKEILNYMKQESLGLNINKLNREIMKQKVKQYIAELFSIHSEQKVSQENLKRMANNYDEVFDELYKRFIYIQKNVATVLNLIKLNKNTETLDKKEMEREIKEKIQYKCGLYQDSLSSELKDLLKEDDLLFDWAYEKYLDMQEQEKTQEIKSSSEKNNKKEKELQVISLEHNRRAEIINFVEAKESRRIENRKGQNKEEDLWEK